MHVHSHPGGRNPVGVLRFSLLLTLGYIVLTVVAGIRAHYTPEELIGKQIVVVANLQPAVLRGVESQGMLLAASDGEKVVILSPEKPTAPGAKVR